MFFKALLRLVFLSSRCNFPYLQFHSFESSDNLSKWVCVGRACHVTITQIVVAAKMLSLLCFCSTIFTTTPLIRPIGVKSCTCDFWFSNSQLCLYLRISSTGNFLPLIHTLTAMIHQREKFGRRFPQAGRRKSYLPLKRQRLLSMGKLAKRFMQQLLVLMQHQERSSKLQSMTQTFPESLFK